jgi:hypothetical protein
MTMLGKLEQSFNLVGLILLMTLAVAVIIANNSWRVGQVRWRIRAWINRRRHPHLAVAYHIGTDTQARYLLAQQMMMRDRARKRLDHNGTPGPKYPNVWDYYYEPGRIAYRMMVSRVASRRADETRILDELKRIRVRHFR